jgi:hypothetical protein
MLCDAVPVLFDFVPMLSDAVPVLSDAMGRGAYVSSFSFSSLRVSGFKAKMSTMLTPGPSYSNDKGVRGGRRKNKCNME